MTAPRIPAPHVNVPSPNRLRLQYDMPSSPIGYRNLGDDELVEVVARFIEADEQANVNRVYLALRGTPWASARARIKVAYSKAVQREREAALTGMATIRQAARVTRTDEDRVAAQAEREADDLIAAQLAQGEAGMAAIREAMNRVPKAVVAEVKAKQDRGPAPKLPREECPECHKQIARVLDEELFHALSCPRHPAALAS